MHAAVWPPGLSTYRVSCTLICGRTVAKIEVHFVDNLVSFLGNSKHRKPLG